MYNLLYYCLQFKPSACAPVRDIARRNFNKLLSRFSDSHFPKSHRYISGSHKECAEYSLLSPSDFFSSYQVQVIL